MSYRAVIASGAVADERLTTLRNVLAMKIAPDPDDDMRIVPRPWPPHTASDPVKRPAHYTKGGVEVIDFIDQTLDGYTDPRVAYYIGNALKYLARAPHKGATQQDLEKAEYYLRRAINRVAAHK
jgi:hypothetical protein